MQKEPSAVNPNEWDTLITEAGVFRQVCPKYVHLPELGEYAKVAYKN